MNLDSAIAAIRQRLDAAWTATPVVHEGRPHTPAADQGFLLCEVAPSPAVFASIGAPEARLVRRPGAILVHVHVPLSEIDPDAAARVHAAAVAEIYEAAEFAGVVCRAATVGAGAESDGGRPAVVVLDPTDPTHLHRLTLYGALQRTTPIRHDHHDSYSMQLIFEEWL